MKKYYIAYGSNLSVEQMRHRCPAAKIAGTAVLKDWKLAFRYHATIEPCEGAEVPVLIWSITEPCERSLDIYEGYPSYYFKRDLAVRMTPADGSEPVDITAMVYIMSPGRERMLPSCAYYDIIANGYRRFGFDPRPLDAALREFNSALDELLETGDD